MYHMILTIGRKPVNFALNICYYPFTVNYDKISVQEELA
jgi:hypothetical protein